MGRIASTPTDGLTYDPNEPRYWNRTGLQKEIVRVYDICLGCRLCFNLCPSFPALFEAADAKDGEVLALTRQEEQRVVDLCYGCKLCEVKCPYTPALGHEFQLDFPQLMLRARAVKVREQGGPALREKLLGNPDRLGKLGSITPKLANWANRTSFHRVLMEKMLGIHRDKRLPNFAGETFEKWIGKRGVRQPLGEPAAKVALFYTCFVNYNNTAPGKAAIEVLEKNSCAIACPKQNCCGMPALDGGDIEFAKKEAAANLESLLPLVRDGYKVAAINPTCSLTMRLEYPRLLGTAEAGELSAAIVDTHELLFGLKRSDKFNRDFRSTPGTIAYHIPCHLKAQSIGFRSRDLMRLIPETTVTSVEACCSHDGTWAMKKEFFALSMKWGGKAFEGMRDAHAQIMSTDCPLAALQIEQATGTRPIHPIEVLARAYRVDGFPKALTSLPLKPQPGEGIDN
jgi:glycerol-3-phosphate dehydrogenase subunit C